MKEMPYLIFHLKNRHREKALDKELQISLNLTTFVNILLNYVTYFIF